MSNLTNETLMAYVDGEADAVTRSAVEIAMANDPRTAQHVARLQAQREHLRHAFSSVLNEPVPDRLVNAARNTFPQTTIVDLAGKRAARTKRRWSWPEWTAMAASVVFGAIITQITLRSSGDNLLAEQRGELIARGKLDQALSARLATEAPSNDTMRIAMSYRSKNGPYCRLFSVRNAGALAGIACRERNVWRIETLARHEDLTQTGNEYRMANSPLPSSLLQTAQEQMAGEPLELEAEVRARKHGWQ